MTTKYYQPQVANLQADLYVTDVWCMAGHGWDPSPLSLFLVCPSYSVTPSLDRYIGYIIAVSTPQKDAAVELSECITVYSC